MAVSGTTVQFAFLFVFQSFLIIQFFTQIIPIICFYSTAKFASLILIMLNPHCFMKSTTYVLIFNEDCNGLFLRNTQSAYQLMNRMQPATCRYLWYLYSVLFYVHVKNEQVYQIFISHLVCCIMKSVTCMCGVPRYNALHSTCISVNYPIEQYVVHIHDSIIMMVVNFFVYYVK